MTGRVETALGAGPPLERVRVLAKPFGPEELADQVRDGLEERSRDGAGAPRMAPERSA
jgi:hypothetical protein